MRRVQEKRGEDVPWDVSDVPEWRQTIEERRESCHVDQVKGRRGTCERAKMKTKRRAGEKMIELACHLSPGRNALALSTCFFLNHDSHACLALAFFKGGMDPSLLSKSAHMYLITFDRSACPLSSQPLNGARISSLPQHALPYKSASIRLLDGSLVEIFSPFFDVESRAQSRSSQLSNRID